MKKLICVIFLLLVACAPEAPLVTSDNKAADFAMGARTEIDENIYVISGTVEELPQSLVRQYSAASGRVGGFSSGGTGYVSGYYHGDVLDGKSFIRFRVDTVSPGTALAKRGDIVILKVTDTKATALLHGDKVEFKCRAQHEPVAATLDGEYITPAHSTWELDYCRLTSPAVEYDQQDTD